MNPIQFHAGMLRREWTCIVRSKTDLVAMPAFRLIRADAADQADCSSVRIGAAAGPNRVREGFIDLRRSPVDSRTRRRSRRRAWEPGSPPRQMSLESDDWC